MGVLLHPSSLPGPFGIGDLGPEARRFVDWLHDAGASVWQVLPLCPPGGPLHDVPYASWAALAGNPRRPSATSRLRGILLIRALGDRFGSVRRQMVSHRNTGVARVAHGLREPIAKRPCTSGRNAPFRDR